MSDDTLVKSRFCWSTLSAWPIENWPTICTTISPAIRLRQANAQPCFIPATYAGSDAGSTRYR